MIFALRGILQNTVFTAINLDISRLRVSRHQNNIDGVVFQLPTMEDLNRSNL
jgi:hypothetical protein